MTDSKWLAAFCLVLIFVGFPLVGLSQWTYNDHEHGSARFLHKVASSPPNEIGDTLAGIFGSLAFLAAAIAVVMQSRELAAQREELRLTRVEFSHQRKATEDMARAMAAQVTVYEDEQKQRNESRAQETFSEQLSLLKSEIEGVSKYLTLAENNQYLIKHRYQKSDPITGRTSSHEFGDLNLDDYFEKRSMEFVDFVSKIPSLANKQGCWPNQQDASDHLDSLIHRIERIEKIFPELSLAQQTRFERLRLNLLRVAIIDYCRLLSKWRRET